MQPPKIPDNEVDRLRALKLLEILDSANEERFDRVTRIAKRLFNVPISVFSLVDTNRQWFKSKQGVEVSETPREVSFCGHAINAKDVFLVPDTFKDPRFFDNPLVIGKPNIRFYAGYPIKVSSNFNIGVLCLIDTKPRNFDELERRLLCDLGEIIEQELNSTQMAMLDQLTMLSNRRGFYILSNQVLKVCNRKKINTAIIVFDLDNLKEVNDTYGHSEGDEMIKLFSLELSKVFGDYNIICRWGGDEFVALVPYDVSEGRISVFNLLSRFQQKVERRNNKHDVLYKLKFSFGICFSDYNSTLSIENRIIKADKEMYSSKAIRRSHRVKTRP
ncbi:sensor domain-containing diguanylate cyclase [Vibrio sp. VGrn 2]|uniref:sensor domain-containing diguanylate cyclase n=1 Tax=Vibrio sp. VGrn 2 TaxID=2419839 RepID=UPI00128D2F2F|nr:sensor domain-containing diguanylate cyclase [Vibrio sp. VGrn 2]MPS41556.1 sensor domain-containing diguanylate cyclase [Vibrio sp. VGrn 2]